MEILSSPTSLQHLPFHLRSEGDCFSYALAHCACTYRNQVSLPATLVLYYSPSCQCSRFSIAVHDNDGQRRLQHQGPEYSNSIEATLLDAWATFGIPAACWQLFPHDRTDAFPQAAHAGKYRRARKELARALYSLRTPAWMAHEQHTPARILPPAQGFIPVNAMALTLENGELLQATAEMGQHRRTDD